MSLRHNLVPHHLRAIRVIPGPPRQIVLKGQIMREFIVTGSYATRKGNFGRFRYRIKATDEPDAFRKAEARLIGRRGNLAGKLDMSASLAS